MCTSSEDVAENYSVSLIGCLQFNDTFSTTRQYRAFRSKQFSLRFGKWKQPGSLVGLHSIVRDQRHK